jgi:hypothetical protein
MKIKNYFIPILTVLSAILLSTCELDNPGDIDNMDYAARAREIVDDLYIYDGTQEDSLRFFNLYDHFSTILDILGISYDESAQADNNTVTMTEDQIDLITNTLLMEGLSYFSDSESSVNGRTYYSLDEIAVYLDNSSDWQIERDEGYGPITADDLKSVMDYYISLYENNNTIDRQYFAGYLIGAISKNNPDAGTYADQYSMDRLQLFLFLIDAFDLPEGLSFDSLPQRNITDSIRVDGTASSSSKSYWGAGAKKLKIKPSNTRQKVIDILDDGIKTYAYKFTLSGPSSIYCGTWDYTANAIRTCQWTEKGNDPLAPLDCFSSTGVPGLNVSFEEYTQEHWYLAPLVPQLTDSSGSITFEIYCEKQCPPGKEISHIPGTTNVNGLVTAKFTGTDSSINYPIFPATAVFKLTERVGDQIECHKD